MTEIATRPARRLTPPGWRDSRLLVGILLVLVATTTGAWVVGHADDTEPVYAAKSEIVPGQLLTSDDLTVVDVRLGEGATAYVSAVGAPPADAYALRALRAGELVPVADVGSASQVSTRSVTLTVDATSAESLRRGAAVDVWVNRPAAGTTLGRPSYTGPQLLLSSAVVARVADEGRVLGAGAGRTVALLVPVEAVPKVVGDIDAGAKITLVPAPGGVAGSST